MYKCTLYFTFAQTNGTGYQIITIILIIDYKETPTQPYIILNNTRGPNTTSAYVLIIYINIFALFMVRVNYCDCCPKDVVVLSPQL